MAVRISRYVPPGVYVEEQVVQAIPAFVGLPRQICIIGEGEHCKTIVNEERVRAYITKEVVTPDSGGIFVLAHSSDLKKSTMFLFKNDDLQAADQFTIAELIAVAPAAVIASPAAPGNIDNGTHSYRVTFVVNALETEQGASSVVVTVVDKTVNGQIQLTALPLGPTGTTARKIYRTVAGNTGLWRLVTTINNNTATTFTDNVADLGLGANAPTTRRVTKVTINALSFDLTADYTFSYQALGSEVTKDILATTVTSDCGRIVAIGSFPSTKRFIDGSDYSLDVGTNSVSWLAATAAAILGSVGTPFDFSVGGGLPKTLKVTVDGGAEQTITFLGADTGFGSPATVAIADVLTKINGALVGAVATNSSGKILITSSTIGPNSSITIGAGTANSVLGYITGAFNRGAGNNPAQGESFFVTYQSERPDSEYNVPILSTSLDQLMAKIGPLTSTNALALAGQIVFEQKPPFVYHIQVKNTGTGAAAQDLDYVDAIKGAELNPDLTDIVVLGHPTTNGGGVKPLVRQALREHVADQSSLLSKAERMGWFGLPAGTPMGDGETPGTFVYVATQELQVSADSPARGRFVLTGSSFLRKTYRFADGTVKQIKLDSTYLTAGVAALMASFLSPSEGLLRKEVVGLDEVALLSIGDRDFMASNGINLVQSRGGVNVCFDPQSTDLTSAEFTELNVMAEKDNVVKRVRKRADDTLIGIVPDDLGQFIFELKSVVAGELNSAITDGAIAPFQNDDGTIRNIDLSTDIIVRRRSSDPTAFDFRFSFFVKFIVKRLFGTFSVSIPSGS